MVLGPEWEKCMASTCDSLGGNSEILFGSVTFDEAIDPANLQALRAGRTLSSAASPPLCYRKGPEESRRT
jgi:hypothetical protein